MLFTVDELFCICYDFVQWSTVNNHTNTLTTSVKWQRLGQLGHQGRPSVVRGSEQSVIWPYTTRPSGQALSDER